MIISRFHGRHRFLSNFWPAVVQYDGWQYPTVEHAYQAAKTVVPAERATIQFASSPGRAKRYGKSITIRSDWDDVKLQIMEQLLRQKFDNVMMRHMLNDTYPHKLIEGNSWGDTYWGVCRGTGENHLGKLLMKIRDEIRKAG